MYDIDKSRYLAYNELQIKFEYSLIKSGGGTGPVMLRQPEKFFKVPNPAEKIRKMRFLYLPLLSRRLICFLGEKRRKI